MFEWLAVVVKLKQQLEGLGALDFERGPLQHINVPTRVYYDTAVSRQPGKIGLSHETVYPKEYRWGVGHRVYCIFLAVAPKAHKVLWRLGAVLKTQHWPI